MNEIQKSVEAAVAWPGAWFTDLLEKFHGSPIDFDPRRDPPIQTFPPVPTL